MTISTLTRKTVFAGDGSNTAFGFTFQVRGASDLQVYYTDATGAQSLLASNLYTVTLNAIPAGQLWPNGGTVTYPLTGSPIATSTFITVARTVALVQSASLINQGGYYPQTVEQALDLVTMEVQQNNEILTRTVTLPISSTASAELPSPVANASIGWNASATALVNIVGGGGGTGGLSLPLAVAQGGTGSTNAATARAALGAAGSGANTDITSLAAPALGAATATTQASSDSSTKVATTSFAQSLLGSSVLRSYLAGCTLSTAGGSGTMSIAAGSCADTTNAASMVLAAIAKTTAGWAVGTANGGLDTGSIANSTWYSFYVIKRVDTGVVDVIFSTSASTPTLPANYTLFRRIGSGKTDGSAHWIAFIQDGDYVRWSASVLDVNTTNPGNSAISSTLTVPTGVNVQALCNVQLTSGTTSALLQLSDLAAADEAPSDTAAPLSQIRTSSTIGVSSTSVQIRTNTSAQIRYRMGAGDGSTVVRIATLGWLDRRGRDA